MSSDRTSELKPLNIALLTVSDTRGPDEDTSGQFLEDSVVEAGHRLVAAASCRMTSTWSGP